MNRRRWGPRRTIVTLVHRVKLIHQRMVLGVRRFLPGRVFTVKEMVTYRLLQPLPSPKLRRTPQYASYISLFYECFVVNHKEYRTSKLM